VVPGVVVNGLCSDNGKPGEVCVNIGEKVDVLVELANSTLDQPLTDLSLEVRPFVPSSSSSAQSPTSIVSTVGSLLVHCIAVVGSESVVVPAIPVAGVHSHRMGLAFCSPGTYKLLVRCRPYCDESVFKTVSVWEHVPAVDIVVKE
jgi:hypothetical protein